MTREALDEFRFGGFGKSARSRVLGSASQQASNGCFLTALLLRFVVAPHQRLEKLVQETKAKMKWDGGGCVVAMHVRHGWRAASNAHLWPREYMMHARRTGCKRILLITENQKVRDERARCATLGAGRGNRA